MDDINKFLIKTRRFLHQIPELGLECYQTSAFIADELLSYGFSIEKNIAKTGIIGTLNKPNATKTICLRADMDALPIVEKTNHSFQSNNKGTMHACGHDAHAAILLAVCKYFSQHTDELKCNLKAVFQPAEEGPLPGGAIHFVEHLKDVDAFFALHVTNEYPCGKIALKKGVVTAAPDIFDITIQGIGTHASTPQYGKNPLLSVAEIILAFEKIANENKQDCVLTTSAVNCGNAANVISDKAVIRGTLRTTNEDLRQQIHKQMNLVVNEIAIKRDIEINYNMNLGYDMVNNDDQMVDYISSCASTIIKKDNIISMDKPRMFGEDFSYLMQISKGAMFFLGTGNESLGITHNLHSPEFDIDENALEIGYRIMKEIILNFEL